MPCVRNKWRSLNVQPVGPSREPNRGTAVLDSCVISPSARYLIESTRLAAGFVLAMKDCEPQLRDAAYELFEQLQNAELDSGESLATAALIAEILFQNRSE